jgi:lipoprotein NlpD
MPARPSSLTFWPLCVLTLVLVGCASPRHRAPVEARGPGTARPPAVVSVPAAPGTAGQATDVDPTGKPPPPGVENAGKPGYYTVKPGDTLIRISLEHGQNWREIVRWNNLENPNVIEVGQVLRVVPPTVDAGAAMAKGVTPGRVDSRPLDGRPADAAAVPGSAASAVGVAPAASTTAAATPSTAPVPASSRDEDDLTWSWPAGGGLLGNFEEGRNKGLLIAGKAGDPVLAAADGRVVYAGAGLRGYGNLVIVKHNNTYLTAYAHNQALLVKEDQAVRRGQKIAEMGASDADRVQLHFEIRRQGKPIDPSRMLPPR